MKTINETIGNMLDDIKEIQLASGSHDDYGQGLYNGLELAKIILLGGEPEYVNKKFKIKKRVVQAELPVTENSEWKLI